MIKAGVDLRGLVPQMAVAYAIAQEIYRDRGQRCTITAGADGRHGPNSLHSRDGLCRAIDLRTRVLEDPSAVADELRAALGSQFDVVLEPDHIHVEFDPKAPVSEPV